MATYKQVQAYVKAKHGKSVATCHIAHVKELLGLPLGSAPNRISPVERVKPCPLELRPLIEEAMRILADHRD